ncbi:hypothetical protein PH552_01085 [Rhizobium sp. CNPSo 3968]|uniref:hypothetical protein n=1 Tax=Rhizobium sp. CNPSo 3968 TaxID=3021408 RepID=UPI00254F78FA|nr:hypothetical protein [Rhizobium sp. CNPSo 3968]MDK4717944.1 hypothetical protein [Rhizobium sp. CNPSo 3968]
MHALVLLAAVIAAIASVGMRGRASAALLFMSSFATIIVSGRDLFPYAKGAPMDGNLRLAVVVLLLPMFPPTNLILLQKLYRSARDLAMPTAVGQGGQFGSPLLLLVAIAMVYVLAVGILALQSAF